MWSHPPTTIPTAPVAMIVTTYAPKPTAKLNEWRDGSVRTRNAIATTMKLIAWIDVDERAPRMDEQRADEDDRDAGEHQSQSQSDAVEQQPILVLDGLAALPCRVRVGSRQRRHLLPQRRCDGPNCAT